MKNRLVNIAGLCCELKLPIAWVREQVEKNSLPHINARGTLLFNLNAVEKFLLKQADCRNKGNKSFYTPKD